ncbi:MAG: SpoIIE family protein phosphatase [Bacteroidia bacterium]|nr:SpoIIE family protein phosphatase [Bacteroidia bacterium]
MDKKTHYNPYHTTDPQKLLELKRLEADTLLDLIRSVYNPDLKTIQICILVRNALKVQLGINKQSFYYEMEGEWIEGICHGFESLPSEYSAKLASVSIPAQLSEENSPYLAGLGVEYVIPVKIRGLTKACFLLAEFADSEEELQNDIIFIETVGHILYSALHNRQLIRERFRQEAIKKELEVAETIQKQFLISDFTKFTEFDVFAQNLAYHGVGGDYFDILKRGKNTSFVCIADVSGKGMSAALLMSNLQANLRALCAQYDYLPLIITELNQNLFEMTKGEKFVTLFLAKIDFSARKIHYINAGHNYPLFIHKDKIAYLESHCVFLGAFNELNPPEETVLSYEAGDLLFLYTDGLSDQTNQSGESFGEKRIETHLWDVRNQNAKSISQSFINQFTTFANNAELVDDLTLLTIKF